MASAGLNRETGRLLTDFDHVVQSIEVIMTTGIGERVLREWFGFPGLRLLGELGNEFNITRFFQAISIALTLRQLNGVAAEPRFRLVRIVPIRLTGQGELSVYLDGVYYPRGHLGDFTPESGIPSRLKLQSENGILKVSNG